MTRVSVSSLTSLDIRHLLALLALGSLLFFTGLGGLGLTDRDEGSNAEAAREMLETGEWISPTLNYEPRFAKPAFVYWLISAAYAVLGVNEFSARLPSALCGIGLILLQFLFLSRVCGSAVALVGSLILLLNIETLAIGRLVLTDATLVLCTTLSAYAFWLGMEAERGQGGRYFVGSYVSMACAMLAKGPVGIILPFLAIVPYLSVRRQWRRFWHIGYPIWGIVLVVVIAAPWYAAMFAIHGEAYLAAAQTNTTGRFANPMEGHGGTILFYVPVVLLGFFPWSAFLPATLVHSVQQWKRVRAADTTVTAYERLALFCGLWIVAIFVFFTLSATRLPHYVFPLFPAASTLVALYWARCLEASAPDSLRGSVRWLLGIGYVFGLSLAAVPLIYQAVIDQIAKGFPAAPALEFDGVPLLLGAIVIVGTTSVWYYLRREDERMLAFWAAGGMMAIFLLVVINFALPKFHRHFLEPPQDLATIAGYNLGPDDRLIQFGRKLPSLTFYAQRKVYQINPGQDEKFAPHVASDAQVMILLPARLLPRLPTTVSTFSRVLERDGYMLMARYPLVP